MNLLADGGLKVEAELLRIQENKRSYSYIGDLAELNRRVVSIVTARKRCR